MNNTNRTKKLCIAGVLIALGVVGSMISFPVGASKCAPVQHMINVLAAVLLGPWYGVAMAFLTSLLRNAFGLGTLLAFPGSMLGALCAGLLFWKTKKFYAAFLGEVIGTGLLGGICAYFMATTVMVQKAAFFAYVLPFGVSSLGGAIISAVIVLALQKTKIISLGKYI